jgi:hypothetical protein
MAKAKKGGVDFNKVKDFLVAKGERAGLIVCLLIGVGLLVLGVMNGMANSKKDWVKPFEQGAKAIEVAVRDAPIEEEMKGKYKIPIWKVGDRPVDFAAAPLIPIIDIMNRNRRLPNVLPVTFADPTKASATRHTHGGTVINEARDTQVDYLAVGTRNYEIDFEGKQFIAIVQKGDAKGTSKVSEVLRPTRLIVVNMVYDLSRQLKEHAEALGFATEKELLDKGDPRLLPRVIGLDVVRYKLAPGKDQPEETKLYEFQIDTYDPKKGVIEYKVEPALEENSPLDRFFRSSFIDPVDPEKYHPHVFSGLMTPVPQLLTGPLDKAGHPHYPEVQLKGIKVNKDIVAAAVGEDPKGMMPTPKGNMPTPKMQMPKGGLGLPRGAKGAGGDEQNPMGNEGGPNAPEAVDLPKPWKEIDENQYGLLVEKLFDGYFPFDPLGRFPQEGFDLAGAGGQAAPGDTAMPGKIGTMPKAGFPPKMQKGGGRKKPKEGDDPIGAAGSDKYERHRLIRFIDIDVQPGFTYAYSVQVHLANPFYGRKDAESQEWSKQFLLKASPLCYTPLITIPGEFFFYAVDQKDVPFNDKGKALASEVPYGNDHDKMDSDKVAVQIHRWLEAPPDMIRNRPHAVGDWAIAERLLVRRGDQIGKRLEFNAKKEEKDRQASKPNWINAEVPEWNRLTSSFQIEHEMTPDKDKRKPASYRATGFPIPFQLTNRPPVLVDFEGGKRWASKTAKDPVDDSAYEMLILDSDGKLILLNSARDTADRERVERYNHWRRRVLDRHRTDGPAGGDNMMPKMPMAPKGG